MNRRDADPLPGLCAAILLSVSPLSAVAACSAAAEPSDSQGADRIGLFDIVVAARQSPECSDAWHTLPRQQSLAGVLLRLDDGPVDAEYHWSRTADQSTDRHELTLVPNVRRGLSLRAHMERALALHGGEDGTRISLETGLEQNGIRSKLNLLTESQGGQQVTGADVRVATSLLGQALSARIAYGEWQVNAASGRSARRASDALALEYVRGTTRLSASYTHQLDPDSGEHRSYTAGAALPLGRFGLRRHTAALEAEMAVSGGGNGGATQSISLTDIHRGPRGRRTARIRFSQSATGLRQTTLDISRTPYPDLTLESILELNSGSGTNETVVTLAAKYRF